MEVIKSNGNKLVKLVNSLKKKQDRYKENLFIIEGERAVYDSCLKKAPRFLIVKESYKGEIPDFKTYIVSDSIFDKISDTKNPQGILAVYEIFNNDIKNISKENILILNKISDPGNLGTLLRSALAFSFNNILIDKNSVDLFSPKVTRSTMSALFSLNIYIADNLKKDIEYLKSKDFEIIGTALLKSSKNIFYEDFKSPLGIVIGNEANGIEEDILNLCDKKIIIPMSEKIESLNASVAGSLAMFEVLRREKFNL